MNTQEIVNGIMNKRAFILDEFFKMFLCSLSEKEIEKIRENGTKKIELVEKRNGTEFVYFFRMRRGRNKKQKGV